jgi:methylmalonyl-CoA decarboxylase
VYQFLTLHQNKGIGTVTLNRPQKANALNFQLMQEIELALKTLNTPSLRVLQITAPDQAKIFCSGIDFHCFYPPLNLETQMVPGAEIPPNLGKIKNLESFENFFEPTSPWNQLLVSIETYPVPVVATVQGNVFGGGLELIAACDLIISQSDSQFSLTPAKLGLPYPPHGFSRLLKSLPYPVVKAMYLTGGPYPAQRLHQLGFLHQIPSQDAYEKTVLETLSLLASHPHQALQLGKKTLHALSQPKDFSEADMINYPSERKNALIEGEFFTRLNTWLSE